MKTVCVQTLSSADGTLHLDIPVDGPSSIYEVVVVLQPKIDFAKPDTQQDREWPAGCFEATAGAWQGDLVRDQGQFEREAGVGQALQMRKPRRLEGTHCTQ
jgi:hypothetical protein